MYLFTKRTRNTIKIVWGVLAFFVMLSMVITYSGFTRLSNTQAPPSTAQSELQPTTATTTLNLKDLSTSSPELQQLIKSIKVDMASGSQATTSAPAPVQATPPQPPAPELKFGI